MENQSKSGSQQNITRPKKPVRKSRIGQELTTEKMKVLNYMFDTLCSVRMTAKSYDYGFLSYLVEMAALEAQKEIKQEKQVIYQLSEVSDEGYLAPNMPLKAGR